MNKDNAKDYLPLVQALAEGKVIQHQLGDNSRWLDTANPDFSMSPDSYRVKEEPREVWVNKYPDGSCSGAFKSRMEAAAFICGPGAIQVLYREVIE